MKYLFLLFLLVGCETGANIDKQEKIDLKGTEKVDATFNESRKVEAPQPSNINLNASGNSTVNFTPVTEPPIKRESIDTGRGLKSDSMMDESFSSLYSKHSGLFYLFCAVAFVLAVMGLRWLESTKTAKAVFALGDMIGVVQRKLVDTDRGTEEHKSLSGILAELVEKRRNLELKRK